MVDHELNDLKREFLEEAREKTEEMQTSLDGDNRDSQSLDRLAYLAHQLKGSGGSYGYPRISEDSAALEKALEALAGRSGDRATLDGKMRTHVLNLRTEIERAVRELA